MAQPLPAPSSKWALKYGQMNPTIPRSGYTPIALSFPTFAPPSQSILTHEKFQRERLKGFTSAELAQLDCLPTRELLPGDLQNAIIPLFQRDYWETAPPKPDFTRDNLYPLKNGNGLWTAANDAVWHLMQPSLQIASRMLMSAHMLPWFDALLFGPRRQIPNMRIRDEDKYNEDGNEIDFDDLQSFERRDPRAFDPKVVASQRDKLFSHLQENFGYRFGFMNPGVEHPLGPDQDVADVQEAYAVTFTNRAHVLHDVHIIPRYWRVYTYLDLNIPEILFRGDLNSAERMQIQWQIANTLAHEFMHAIGYLSADLNDEPDRLEIYFEEQAVAELGFSYEDAMNIGQTEPMIQASRSADLVPPLGYWLRRVWPDVTDAQSCPYQQPVLRDPGLSTVNEIFPVPLPFYEDIQQDNFWDLAVMNYGTSLLHYRSVKEGTRIQYKKRTKRKYKMLHRTRISFIKSPFSILNDRFRASVQAINLALQMTPAQRHMMEFARVFLMSSALEELFWTNSEQQRQQMKNIDHAMSMATNMPSLPQNQQDIGVAILDLVQLAMENHEKMIETILELESINKVEYTDRRNILREWNRGTRVFLRRLDSHLRKHGQDAEEEMLRLEFARMVLWNPEDKNMQHGADYAEMQLIDKLTSMVLPTDCQMIRVVCGTILETGDVSILGESYARIFLLEIDEGNPYGWMERYDLVTKIQSRLQLLAKNPPQRWIAVMSILVQKCELLIKRLRPFVLPEQ